ncbi:DUF3077 domain-containing protein [Pseudomonas sp.]|uniref:DUF3077 domain-containing protein n=1 Tax=Pseudomonas sp. TaxID=306 RepID=UPI0028A83061|nr:DUF3077 domain-containing protein [Pseudomonas sp.]
MNENHRSGVTVGVQPSFELEGKSMYLFRVMPGIPFEQAYEQVSVLLGYIRHLIHEGDLADDHRLLGAADYLSGLAKAIMDDIEIARARLT